MGLACSQARLLTLTARKADCEYGISIDSMHKMALTREMSELSQDYYSKLQSKKIAYYHDGQYYKMNYNYLMGNGEVYNKLGNTRTGEQVAVKSDYSMILTDYKGQVVLSNEYAQAIIDVLGVGAMDKHGRGGTFSQDKIVDILTTLTNCNQSDIQTVVDGKKINHSFLASEVNTLTGKDTGNNTIVLEDENKTSIVNALVDFYYPIFAAAANNGWTTEYNQDMQRNDEYVSDAIVTGSFQLTTVNNHGEYDEGATLNYFITAGMIQERVDSDVREELTAWYEAEKQRISEKENIIDLHISDLSTELEAVKTEIQSIQSLIDDAVSSVFDWGGG